MRRALRQVLPCQLSLLTSRCLSSSNNGSSSSGDGGKDNNKIENVTMSSRGEEGGEDDFLQSQLFPNLHTSSSLKNRLAQQQKQKQKSPTEKQANISASSDPQMFDKLKQQAEQTRAQKDRLRAATVNLFTSSPSRTTRSSTNSTTNAEGEAIPDLHQSATTTTKQNTSVRVSRVEDPEDDLDAEMSDFFMGVSEVGLTPPPPSATNPNATLSLQREKQQLPHKSPTKKSVLTSTTENDLWRDDDDDDDFSTAQEHHKSNASLPITNKSRGSPRETALDDPSQSNETTTISEHVALDDAFTYFPAFSLDESPTVASKLNNQKKKSGSRYVPGRQVITPGTVRYRLEVQYHGTDFDGWNKSTEKMKRSSSSTDSGVVGGEETDGEVVSKQRAKAALEDALAVALDVDHIRVEAGAMPETGVHVRRLVCHFDAPSAIELQPRTILQRATLWLEKKKAPLAILSCHPCVNQQFHARHSATRRVYVYRICNRIAPPLFDAGLQWHVDRYLDVDRMSRFATALQGTHDFGFFADAKMAYDLRKLIGDSGQFFSPDSPSSGTGGMDPAAIPKPLPGARGVIVSAPVVTTLRYAENPYRLATTRTLDALRVVRQDDEVLIWFVGKSFLRRQVRTMVAVLKMIGQGLWTEHELNEALRVGFEPSRGQAAKVRPTPAPAHGLTLWDVEYPEEAHGADRVPFVDSGPLEIPGTTQFDGDIGRGV